MPDDTINTTTVEGSQSAQIDISQADMQAQNETDQLPSPEKLGVTQAQFDKYYNSGTSEYNWQAHAREAEFINGQYAEQTIDTQYEAQNAEAFESAEDAVEQAGLNWEDLSRKIGMTGDIDQADYDALTQMGLPFEIVQQHVQLVSDQVQTHVALVTEAFGGQERWGQTQAWADANMSEAEIDQLNTMLGGSNYQLAVDLLMQKAGTQALNTPMSQGGGEAVQPYASQMEMVADQRKPEYRRDAAFRQKVMMRASASNWANPNHTQ